MTPTVRMSGPMRARDPMATNHSRSPSPRPAVGQAAMHATPGGMARRNGDVEGTDDDPYLVLPYTKDQLREGPTYERDEDFTGEHERGVSTATTAGSATGTRSAPVRRPRPRRRRSPRRRSPTRIDRGEDPNQVAVKRWGV